MHPKEQLTTDLKTAMKSGDKVRRDVIRGALSTIKEAEQRKREMLTNQALKKHNVHRPTVSVENARTDEERARAEEAAQAYNRAVEEAIEADRVEANAALDEAEEMAIIQKLVKQREESIAEAKKAKRNDIAQNEQAELEILNAYLPQQLTREEIEAEAHAVIAEIRAEGPRDMGRVMKPLMDRLKGRADGKLVSDVVRSALSE